MSDLDRAIREAEQNNAGRALAEEAKHKVEKEAKKKAKEKAAEGAKKAAKGAKKGAHKAHRFASKHSKLYRGTASKAKGSLKALKKGAQAVFKFLITPPIGWVVSGIVIAILLTVVNSGAFDNMGGVITDDDTALLFSNVCVIPEYSNVVEDSDASESDWTTPGTRANKNAKTIFDFWVSRGMSGAGAAGIVGWVNTEGGFAMFGRAEGVYETTQKKGSLKYGIEPIPYGDYSVGGGGVYQFTPFTKYAPLGSSDWENAGKMNQFVAHQLANGDWNPSVDMTGGKNTFNDMARGTDPEMTVMMWNAYERANQATVKVPQKKSDARKAYELFDGAKYAYDDARFQKHFGKPINDDGTPSPVYVDPCAREGESWRGSGGQPSISSGSWLMTNMPDELLEYALDPRSLGMLPNDMSTWPRLVSRTGPNKTQTGGQCTDLSASLMHVLWSKDGEPLETQGGNGIDVAGNLANHHGVALSNIPSGGAIFSAKSSSHYGHTGIVSHVFDNGDFLIVEQNVKRLSGDSNGTPLTWNYRYVPKSDIEEIGYEFFDPASAGYEINSGAMSL